MMKKILFISIFILSGIFANAQVISVDSARTLGVDSTVTISGIITNGDELGTIRYMQDSTAGIAVYDYTFSQTAVRGDSVTITGTLKDYNQLLEVDPVDSFTVHSSGNALPAPEVITPNQLGESVEGELVRINNAVFNAAGSVFSSNTSYTFNASGESAEIFVRSNHPLIGQIVPSNPVNLVGLGSQYDYSNPSGGYQLILRDGNDIIASSSINLASTLSVSNISQSGFDINWSTDAEGTTEIFYGNTPDLELGKLSANMADTTDHTISITGANASELFYIKAFSVKGSDTASSSVRSFITQSNSSGEMKAYFTTAVDTSYSTGEYAVELDNTVDDTLVAYLERAKYSIDFSVYTFNSQNIANLTTALNDAYARGVDVRVIYNGDNNGPSIQNLNSGIGKIGSPTTSQYGIMHNKFVVIDAESPNPDEPIVWTGATNFSDGQINTDDNNVIIIQDKSLAITYKLEFDEMFGSDSLLPDPAKSRFGPDKLNNTPHEFIIDGKRVECYFSPSDNTNDKIIDYIDSADDNLNIATMLITRSDIGYALEDAIDRGVNTKIMINSSGQSSSSLVTTLETKLDTNFKTNDNGNNIMHHKYMIVDEGTNSDPVLLTGSHNWSYSANNVNDENTLIIHDDTMANIYLQEFMKFFQSSTSNVPETLKSSISVWPNPASDRLNIEIDHNGDAIVNVYNISGQKILTMDIEENNEVINVNNMDRGMYILELISGDKVTREKIMVH
ncbi:MAG: T9SS type A sorting domain-containing protein [Bacteroidales bacterium]|nr:T9SS type A sorting domain-containing protein [Bacteroidales bacterium]MCF8327057.1 T9SS type A sorting domain-containing protein [Bacteroidales bacterium]